MKPTLLILAAGLGSRYGSLKQMDKLGPSGETLLEYSVYDAIRAGFGKVVFVIRRDIENDFKESVLKKLQGKIAVDYVFQELDVLPKGFTLSADRVKPWGTGHAILVAASKVKEPFAVINADDFYGDGSFKLLADFLMSPAVASDKTYSMVGFQLEKTLSEFGFVSRGVCATDANFHLISANEKTHIERSGNDIISKLPDGTTEKLDGKAYVSMNCWGFTPSLFRFLEEGFIEFLQGNVANPKAEFYIPFMVNELIEKGKVNVEVLKGTSEWFGMTYQEDRMLAVEKIRSLIQAGVYPENLWK
ncbi:MAG TPA: sugar phosphate nucleotidyltransferase [Bacteroidales bacterium]|nr:sugar phosphate nucleotidyltransferase [Bacteroidales bacterium]